MDACGGYRPQSRSADFKGRRGRVDGVSVRGDRALEAALNPQERPSRRAATAAAAFTLVPALVLGALGIRLVTATGGLGSAEAAAWLAVIVALMFLTLPALGILQADVRCNTELPPRARGAWLALLMTLPGSGGVYWLRHVRR